MNGYFTVVFVCHIMLTCLHGDVSSGKLLSRALLLSLMAFNIMVQSKYRICVCPAGNWELQLVVLWPDILVVAMLQRWWEF